MPAVLDNSPEPIRHRTQAARPVRTRSAAHLRVDQSRVPVEVLVLVPRAQKAAVDAALLTLRHEKAGLGALLVAKDKPAQGNELSPLKIPEMVIQPLVPIGDTQETTDGSARF